MPGPIPTWVSATLVVPQAAAHPVPQSPLLKLHRYLLLVSRGQSTRAYTSQMTKNFAEQFAAYPVRKKARFIRFVKARHRRALGSARQVEENFARYSNLPPSQRQLFTRQHLQTSDIRGFTSQLSCFVTACAICGVYTFLGSCSISPRGDRFCERCVASCGLCACGNIGRVRAPIDPCECSLCFRVRVGETIYPYSTNPILQLKFNYHGLNKKQIYQGVELEVECGTVPALTLAAQIKPVLGDKAIAKHDGSLRNGFEICTVPMSPDEHQRYWEKVFAAPVMGQILADTEQTAGLHIHASRAPMSTMQISRFIYFWNRPENRNFIEAIAGRKGNSYTQYKHETLLKVANKIRGREERPDKYEAVNILHPDSIEVRSFQSTKDYTKMIGRLESVMAGTAFANSYVKVNDFTWQNFLNWTTEKANRKVFAGLGAYVKTLDPAMFIPDKRIKRTLEEFRQVLGRSAFSAYQEALSCGCASCNTFIRRLIDRAGFAPEGHQVQEILLDGDDDSDLFDDELNEADDESQAETL